MLYDRWRDVATAHAKERALFDLATDRSWTFAQLAAASESMTGTGWAVPRGRGADCVIEVLAAWRQGRGVCPLEPGQPMPPLPSDLPSDIVHLKRTSATTGPPRSILFTASQLAQDAANIVRTMTLQPDRPNVGVLSLAHSYAFSSLVLPLALHGIPLFLADSPLPERVRLLLRLHPRWTLPAVPALWRTWLDADLLEGIDVQAISAGAPLPLPLEVEAWERHGLKIHNFYGASECGGIAYDDSEQPRQDPCAIGRPMQGVDVSMSAGGCLQVRGPAVAEGYWPSHPDDGLGGGLFQTQDLGDVLDGWVHLRGRAGDMINVAGRKVSPDSLETLLLKGPCIEDCLVFGVEQPQSRRGEEIVVCYVARGEAAETQCRQWAAERLPAWQVPRHWWRVTSLNTNERGKRSRREWRERFLREQT